MNELNQLPARYENLGFENWLASSNLQKTVRDAAEAYAKDFTRANEIGQNLVLIGPSGTGKTHLAAAVANHVMSQGFSTLFVPAMDLVRQISDCKLDKGTRALSDVFAELNEPDLLIIDDICLVEGDDEARIFYEVIDDRYKHQKPLLITTSYTKDDLNDVIGYGAVHRLMVAESVFLSFQWEPIGGGK